MTWGGSAGSATASRRSTTGPRSPRGASRRCGGARPSWRPISGGGRVVLKLTDVVTHYGPLRVLKSVNLEVRAGEIVCLLGGNASGKSTTMKTVLGVVGPTAGRVDFEGDRIDGLPTEVIVRRGISLAPEARRIFARMPVWENLAMGAFPRQKAPAGEVAEDFERVWALFPRLLERQHQLGGTLSGGEQQMLAIGRALMRSEERRVGKECRSRWSPYH